MKKKEAFEKVLKMKNEVFSLAIQKTNIDCRKLQKARKNCTSEVTFFKRKLFAKAMNIDKDELPKSSSIVVIKGINCFNANFGSFFKIQASYCFSNKVDIKFAQLCERLKINSPEELKPVLFALVVKAVIRKILTPFAFPALTAYLMQRLKQKQELNS